MKTVQEHLSGILATVGLVRALDVVLADAAGCILATDVPVRADLPARPVAGRDGYAVRSDELSAAGPDRPIPLPVAHDVWADAVEPLRLAPGQCVRIASGAPLPLGADAVVPLEDTDRGTAQVTVRTVVVPGQGVRAAGVDARYGDVALEAGIRLGARQLSLAAAMGISRLRVHPAPRVVILPVGDELLEPGRRGNGVHDANGHALRIAVQDSGAVPIQVAPVPDDRALLRDALEDQLVRADLVLTTGGLSEGARDTVRDVLAPLGTVRFDHVAMDPGRQQGFGMIGPGVDMVPLFALPGHPVAAQVSYEVFVRPALRAMAGYVDVYRPSVVARAGRGWRSPAGLRQFVPAVLTGSPDEGYEALPVAEDPGRLSLSALAGANALAVVPEGQEVVAPGSRVHCLVLEG